MARSALAQATKREGFDVNETPVSVVMPTYNRGNLLLHAVSSVLCQTYTDFELIIVDDGSTDGTQQLLGQLTDSRIKYIYQSNAGISSAMNTGLRAASGTYVARLDSDDEWLPRMLEEAVRVLDEQPSVGLVYAKAQAFDLQGNIRPQVIGAPPKFPDDILKSILCGDFVCTITAVIRKELLDQVGPFEETLKGNEDWDMWIRLANVCKFAFIDTVLAHFRTHPGRITGPSSEFFSDISEGRFHLLDKAFARPDLPDRISRVRPMAYRNAHIDVALRWMSAGNAAMTFRHLRLALATGQPPLTTLVRIVYLVLVYRVLSKHSWGVALAETAVRVRHSLRTRFR